MSTSNVKRKRLNIEDKLTIIGRLEAGEKNINLAKEYGVSHSAISKIIKSKDSIIACSKILTEQQGSLKKMRINRIEESLLEQAVFKWFIQQTSLGKPVTGPLLKDKALDFNKMLNGPTTFKASDGWLSKFKNRHQIQCATFKGEKVSNDADVTNTFHGEFNKYLQDNGFDLDNVYNVTETVLAWKSLPRKVLTATKEKKESSMRNLPKDRVTILTCANATGSHKLPLLLIWKSVEPRCFKNIVQLPVQYRANKNMWITEELFEEWFTQSFIPSVKQRKNAENERFLLLLDNASSHPPSDRLNAIDPTCQVFQLSSNVAALIQPMDQGIIESMKKEYRKRFLQQILLQDIQDSKNVSTFIRKWSILNCCNVVAEAWSVVNSSTLKNGWRRILNNRSVEMYDKLTDQDIINLFYRLSGSEIFTKEQIIEWLTEDAYFPTCRNLADEILQSCEDPSLIIDDIQIKKEDYNDDDDNDCDDNEENDLEVSTPTELDALQALNTFYTFVQSRWDFNEQHHNSLREMKDIAIKLALDTSNETSQ